MEVTCVLARMLGTRDQVAAVDAIFLQAWGSVFAFPTDPTHVESLFQADPHLEFSGFEVSTARVPQAEWRTRRHSWPPPIVTVQGARSHNRTHTLDTVPLTLT